MALADKLKENQVKGEETPIYQIPREQNLKELESLLKETNELNQRAFMYYAINKKSAAHFHLYGLMSSTLFVYSKALPYGVLFFLLLGTIIIVIQ